MPISFRDALDVFLSDPRSTQGYAELAEGQLRAALEQA
jgi:hypothetical protein